MIISNLISPPKLKRKKITILKKDISVPQIFVKVWVTVDVEIDIHIIITCIFRIYFPNKDYN